MRVRTLAEILIPCVADRSWSVISAFEDGSVHVQFIEDIPMARRLNEPPVVMTTDFEWVDVHLTKFAKLLVESRFHTATEALTTYHHHQSYRVMAALLWAGIESLFQINAELRFRLATLIALCLELRGEECKRLFRRVKKLYDVRSKAVHGSNVLDEDLIAHIREVRVILSRLLCSFAEKGRLPCDDELDDLLFL